MKRLLALVTLAILPALHAADYPVPVGVAAAHTFPYSMVGQLTFASGDGFYVGSGTVVQPRGVLTAGHNLYDPQGGWSTDLLFERGRYDDTRLSVRAPMRIYVLAGYQANSEIYGGDSVRSFVRDTGGLYFKNRVAAGGFLGWSTDRSLITGNASKVALGYGAERHSGDEMLAVRSPTPFASVLRTFYESEGLVIEGGMSGGPVICVLPNGSPSLCGVVVSGSDNPISGGIRVMNAGTSNFILTYLSDPASP
jgi:hypothetical protein